jgi:hypothetical protein
VGQWNVAVFKLAWYLTECNMKEASIAKCSPICAIASDNIVMHEHRELLGGTKHVDGYSTY